MNAMTLDELRQLESLLLTFRGTESCGDLMLEDDIKQALFVVQREIRLKTMNPVKQDVHGNMIDGE